MGQVTIAILWLTIEGLYQTAYRDKSIQGALLLALGISIKIIPIIGLFYLFFKGKFIALFFCICFVVAYLLLPSAFIGHSYNAKLLQNWAETINPANNKYVFENDDGIHSLNAIIPAYFYTFNDGYAPAVKLKRQIINVPKDTLIIVTQIARALLLLSSLIPIFYHHKRKAKDGIYIYWQLSYLALVSTLIFPHQPYYAMLYCVLAGSYIILYLLLCLHLRSQISFGQKTMAFFACVLLFIITIKGRDTLGDTVLEILNFYHFEGLANLIFLGFLIAIKPDHLVKMNNEVNLKRANNIIC